MDKKVKISVVIPAYNEINTIAEIIRFIRTDGAPTEGVQVLQSSRTETSRN